MTNELDNQLSLQKLSELQIPKEIHAALDVDGMANRIRQGLSKIDASDQRIRKISEASLLDKLGYWITGETKDAYRQAIQIQGEIQTEVLRLIFLMAFVSGELYKQQQVLERQSQEILENTRRQEQQETKHAESIKKISGQQEEILRLLKDQGKIVDKFIELKKEFENLNQRIQEFEGKINDLNVDFRFVKKTVGENSESINVGQKNLEKLDEKVKKIVIAVIVIGALSFGAVVSLFFQFLK